MGPADRLVLAAYNVLRWMPVLLSFVGVVSYRTGFVTFLAISIFRAAVNLYRNNVMPVEAAQALPLRLP